MFKLKPSEIMFSQDSINNHFDKRSLHSGVLIGETLEDICEGRCSVFDIPTINVMKRDGEWVTADNRRLWVFRQLERLGKCDRILVRETFYIDPVKLNSYNGGISVRVRRSPGGQWHNKQSVIRSPSKTHSSRNYTIGYETQKMPSPVKPYYMNSCDLEPATRTNRNDAVYPNARTSDRREDRILAYKDGRDSVIMDIDDGDDAYDQPAVGRADSCPCVIL